jgi:hypothetical protein
MKAIVSNHKSVFKAPQQVPFRSMECPNGNSSDKLIDRCVGMKIVIKE